MKSRGESQGFELYQGPTSCSIHTTGWMKPAGRLPAPVPCILELHAFQMEGAKMTSNLLMEKKNR